jgi:hypothetical protein
MRVRFPQLGLHIFYFMCYLCKRRLMSTLHISSMYKIRDVTRKKMIKIIIIVKLSIELHRYCLIFHT